MTDRAASWPRAALRLPVPDLRPFLPGNLLPGVWSFGSGAPGPHLVLSALVHGNEIAGALVLARLLRAGVRPLRGRLTVVFANLDAFARFDPADPAMSRYVDEDMNRLWSRAALEGAGDSAELRRARALRPVLEAADLLLDLHSSPWPADPLVLCGEAARARGPARLLGVPVAVADAEGHREGPRLIDHAPFAAPGGHRVALLVEGGVHWEEATVAVLEGAVRAALRLTGLAEGEAPPPGGLWEVVAGLRAATHRFAFARPFRGGEVLPAAGTVLARDGEATLRTPHDDCLLVLPCPAPLRGHLAVRLARRVAG